MFFCKKEKKSDSRLSVIIQPPSSDLLIHINHNLILDNVSKTQIVPIILPFDFCSQNQLPPTTYVIYEFNCMYFFGNNRIVLFFSCKLNVNVGNENVNVGTTIIVSY